MRLDDKREFAAIPLTLGLLGALALIFYAFTQGVWFWLAVGALLVLALVAVAFLGMARPHHPSGLSASSLPDRAARPRGDGVHRVLLIADAACAASELGAALAERGSADRTEVFVVAPALGSRTARWTGDERPYEEATKHLEATLEGLAEARIAARGHVGAHDPLQAADDGLREFAADEIIFSIQASDSVNWLEQDVVESARERYPIRVTALTVTSGEPTTDARLTETEGGRHG
jgi:hypothetical protein